MFFARIGFDAGIGARFVWILHKLQQTILTKIDELKPLQAQTIPMRKKQKHKFISCVYRT